MDPNDIPLKGSHQQFKESMSHWAYEIYRVTFLPLREPVERIVETVNKYCNTPMSVGHHLLMTR